MQCYAQRSVTAVSCPAHVVPMFVSYVYRVTCDLGVFTQVQCAQFDDFFSTLNSIYEREEAELYSRTRRRRA